MIDVLVSTMNQSDKTLLNKMNINCNSVVINQCNQHLESISAGNIWIDTLERGLSKSRNMAIKNATSEICVIADDDLTYNDDMVEIIENAYKKYDDASVIAFYVKSTNMSRPTSKPSHEGYLNHIDTMKLASFMLSFKRNDILDKKILFNINFGAGSGVYSAGEENIFLFDCLRNGLKIVYVDKIIATVSHNESTWWTEKITSKNLEDLGAAYYMMFPKTYLLFGMQFIVRKSKRIDNKNFFKSISHFWNGVKSMKNRNVFFIGDITTDTGPGIANRILVNGMIESKQYSIITSNQTNIFKRIIELPWKIKNTKSIVICIFSKLNFLAIWIAKLFNKKIIYLMHGYVEYEESMSLLSNNKNLKKVHNLEQFIFKNADYIVCVSKKSMHQMMLFQNDYYDKFRYIFNGVSFEFNKNLLNQKKPNHSNFVITSIGGGMIRKNITTICRAIEYIRNNKLIDKNIVFNVIGPKYTEYNKIINYDFVNYFEKLVHLDTLNILSNSDIYIQNSLFETFGLSIIEAFECGCELLVSDVCGCLDCFEGIQDGNIIFDTYDYIEIAEKIIYLYANRNTNIKLKDVSPLATARRFENILNEL